MRIRQPYIVVIAAALPLVIGIGVWWGVSHTRNKPTRTPLNQQANRTQRPARPDDPLQPAMDAYNAGRYKDAEAAAVGIVKSAENSKDPAVRKRAVRARYYLAFAAARQKKMELAGERFAVLKKEASKLPDKGKQEPRPGVASPTLEEEGAYQHAVCTAALGDKEAAEAEYIKFMQDYPESPLIHGAVKRIERLHNGHLPNEAEEVWQQAVRTAQERQNARSRELSMCGPECLAELLRRRGEKADVRMLAEEMQTGAMGTSLLALVETAKKHGFPAKGVALTYKGLLKQPLPLITLAAPGHYVIIDAVTPKEVTVWDPYGKGPGKPATVRYSVKDWQIRWSGIAMVVGQKTGPRISNQ